MLTLTIAAAEAAIGLAILVVFFRNLGSISVEKINQLKDNKNLLTKMEASINKIKPNNTESSILNAINQIINKND